MCRALPERTSQNVGVAQPTTQLNATEQDTLVKQIGLALLRAAPRDWQRVTAEYRAVGRYHELTGEIVTADGDSREWVATHDIATLFGRLRGGMYRDGRGTWFNARYQLDHPSSYNLEYDRDEPSWDLMPPPQAYADELRMFPRAEENIPEWLMRRMSGLGPERPGPRFRIARVFDGTDPGGHPVITRPDLEHEEQDRLLEYLDQAPVVVPGRGYDTDRLAEVPEAAVPIAFHSDGTWIWPAAVNYYLRTYGVSPEQDLIEHIHQNGFTVPEVPEPARQAAAGYVQRSGPPQRPGAPASPPPVGPPAPVAPPPAQTAPPEPESQFEQFDEHAQQPYTEAAYDQSSYDQAAYDDEYEEKAPQHQEQYATEPHAYPEPDHDGYGGRPQGFDEPESGSHAARQVDPDDEDEFVPAGPDQATRFTPAPKPDPVPAAAAPTQVAMTPIAPGGPPPVEEPEPVDHGDPVLDQLQDKLDELRIPDEAYRIGEPADRGWSLERIDAGWRVGWYDGDLTNPAVFGDADDAAAFMLGKLLLNGRPQAQPAPAAPQPPPVAPPQPPPPPPAAPPTQVVAPVQVREEPPEPPQQPFRQQPPPRNAPAPVGALLDGDQGGPGLMTKLTPTPEVAPPTRQAPPSRPPEPAPPQQVPIPPVEPPRPAPTPPRPAPRQEEPASAGGSGGGAGGQQWPIKPLAGEPPLTLFRGKELRELPAGSELDRFGGPNGNLTYVAGTPFEERSLVPEWVNRPYHVYRVQRPLEALAGIAIPWFNQPGGGAAYLLPASVEELLNEGDLIELDPGEPPVD
ncbi:glycohydrolase toxin TNT-related protein [Amycolatopsis magusensis]|uniref:TNT domain-containing protein n=1 Tax=Amycolatopsis magusensis TaxID=882444 RepID=UPI003C2C76BD